VSYSHLLPLKRNLKWKILSYCASRIHFQFAITKCWITYILPYVLIGAICSSWLLSNSCWGVSWLQYSTLVRQQLTNLMATCSLLYMFLPINTQSTIDITHFVINIKSLEATIKFTVNSKQLISIQTVQNSTTLTVLNIQKKSLKICPISQKNEKQVTLEIMYECMNIF